METDKICCVGYMISVMMCVILVSSFFQILHWSDNTMLKYSWKLIFNMALVCHLGVVKFLFFIVTILKIKICVSTPNFIEIAWFADEIYRYKTINIMVVIHHLEFLKITLWITWPVYMWFCFFSLYYALSRQYTAEIPGPPCPLTLTIRASPSKAKTFWGSYMFSYHLS